MKIIIDIYIPSHSQYDNAFSSQRLQSYEVPAHHKQVCKINRYVRIIAIIIMLQARQEKGHQ